MSQLRLTDRQLCNQTTFDLTLDRALMLYTQAAGFARTQAEPYLLCDNLLDCKPGIHDLSTDNQGIR